MADEPANLKMPVSRRGLMASAAATTFGAALLSAGADVRQSAAAGAPATAVIPSLDEMAGNWLDADKVLNPPGIDNLNDFAEVRYDLVSTRFNPGGGMLPQTVTGVPLPVLRLDGKEWPSREMRWSAYEVRRRNPACDGVEVETAVRIVERQAILLTEIAFRNPSARSKTIRVELQFADDTQVAAEPATLSNTTLRPGLKTVLAAARTPDRILPTAQGVTWVWTLSIPGGGVRKLAYVTSCGKADETAAAANARRCVKAIDATFAACKAQWEERWRQAFTPGNGHFSGHLPVLQTNDEPLRRIYYMSVLTVLSCERTQFAISPRDFLTLSDRPGKQYFWDASMMAPVWARLEPAGMKASLRHWLAIDLLSAYALNLSTGKSMGPTWYAFSACNVFNTAMAYIRITGDQGFLDEKMEPSGQTVLARLDEITLLWKQKVPPGQTLANFGAGGNLLESGAPAYLGAVASLNAQSVGMMLEMARLHAARGNRTRAADLSAEAARLLPAVMSLYRTGSGTWSSQTEDGTQVEQRHVVDFIYVSQAISDLLPETIRSEMCAFVKRELMMKYWLRAQSLDDPAATRSGRPDHGPMGSYDGWVALAVAEMARLGDRETAIEFLRRTYVTTLEGPYAQAHEFYGPNRLAYDAPVCVATGPTIKPFDEWTPSRGMTSGGYSSKECISGGAFAGTIIELFGLAATGRPPTPTV